MALERVAFNEELESFIVKGLQLYGEEAVLSIVPPPEEQKPPPKNVTPPAGPPPPHDPPNTP